MPDEQFLTAARRGTLTLTRAQIAQPGNTAILDTGTTLLLIAEATAAVVYTAIPGARMDAQLGEWVYPAAAQGEPPSPPRSRRRC